MNINVTGRNVRVSKRLRDYSEKKISKLEKYFHQIIDIKVVFFLEKLDHVAEVVITGDGVQFLAIERAGDFYSATDLLIDKLEQQVVRYKEKIKEHKGKGVNLGGFPLIDLNKEEEDFYVSVRSASAKPIDNIEAFLEMKMDKSDFILFKKGIPDVNSDVDYGNKNYSVLYNGKNGLRLVEIPFDMIKANNFNSSSFLEYEVEVIKDSPSNPEIELNQSSSKEVKGCNIAEVVNEIIETGENFIPFFNEESKLFNIIYKNGKSLEVLVPENL